MIQSRCFLLRDKNFINSGLSDSKTFQDIFIHLELCYTLHEMKFYKLSSGGARQILSLINTGGTQSR